MKCEQPMLSSRSILLVLLTMGGLATTHVEAINITLDYSYDTNDFFGAGNPDGAAAGAQAKASLEAAADFYSGILDDTFSEIVTPPPFHSSVFDGLVEWNWSLNFNHPATGSTVTLDNQTIATDEYRVFAGARNISGTTLGIGGPGGFNVSSTPLGGFTSGEIDQIDQITADFFDQVENRGEATGFSRWGGAVTFDRELSTNWHYDHISQPTGNEDDFFSVAIHELGHSLGLGASDEWNNYISGSNFTGPAAMATFGGSVPLDCSPGCGHWAENTQSTVFGTSISQEAAMDPNITEGDRKLLTTLDAAALTDIGWEVSTPTYDPADFDHDGDVDGNDLVLWQGDYGINGDSDADGDLDTDGADFLVWQRNYTGNLSPPLSAATAVPEPATLGLGLFFVAMVGVCGRDSALCCAGAP